MVIYLDSNYMCHVTGDSTMTEVETDFFDGKCKTFIEGYRYIPEGETWRSPDGTVYTAMIAPATNYNSLLAAQRQYEEDLAQMSDMEQALEIMGVSP